MQINLYHTLGCHLCELAEQVIERVRMTVPDLSHLHVIKIDIAGHDELVDRYGIRIPVLQLDDQRELDWPFDEQQLFVFLTTSPE